MHHRWASLLVIAAITAFFAVGLSRVELRTIFTDLLPKNHPFVQTYKDHPNFGNPLTVTMMVKRKDGDIYNPETLQKVWNLTRDIDLTPGVDHDQILSISTEKARFSEATPYGIESQPLMGDKVAETPEEIAEFRRRVDKAPNARAFLISHDETATLITATFIERLLDYGVVFEHVQNLAAEARDDDHEIYVAGQPVLTGWVYSHQVAMIGIFGVTASALVLSLVLYMRNLAVHVLNSLNQMFLEDDNPYHNINKSDIPFVRQYMREVAKYAPIFWKYQEEHPEKFQDIFSRTQFSANINESVISEVAVQLEGCVDHTRNMLSEF